MWNERYSSETYAYGTSPNDFLVEMAHYLPLGNILCLAEGEGRNAVWLAQQGYNVTAVDASDIGLAKAQKLAQSKNVTITTIHADLADFSIGSAKWDGIVSIFCHIPEALRCKVHQQCVQGLKAGGVMLLEAYTPEQLQYKTGGPPVTELMMDSDCLRRELQPLEIIHLDEKIRDIQEGEFHNGTGAVVQLVARQNRKC